MSSASLPRLAYAPAARPRGLRRHWRKALAAGFVLAGVIVAVRACIRFSAPYLRQAEVLAEQKKWMDFDPPAGTVSLTNDPDEYARLLPTGNYIKVVNGLWTPQWIGHSETVFRGYSPGGVPEPPNAIPQVHFPTVFLHSRRSSGGHTRLVHLTFDVNTIELPLRKATPLLNDADRESLHLYQSEPQFAFNELDLQVDLYVPATRRPGSSLQRVTPKTNFIGTALDWKAFLVPHRQFLRDRADPTTYGIDGDVKLRVSMGRPDPDNAARFIIPYECDGQAGEVVGQLTDSETIYWERITGPLQSSP